MYQVRVGVAPPSPSPPQAASTELRTATAAAPANPRRTLPAPPIRPATRIPGTVIRLRSALGDRRSPPTSERGLGHNLCQSGEVVVTIPRSAITDGVVSTAGVRGSTFCT